jgi:hypothetical protein
MNHHGAAPWWSQSWVVRCKLVFWRVVLNAEDLKKAILMTFISLPHPQTGCEKRVINVFNFGLDSLGQHADIPQVTGYSF